jgi:hypothetical protein
VVASKPSFHAELLGQFSAASAERDRKDISASGKTSRMNICAYLEKNIGTSFSFFIYQSHGIEPMVLQETYPTINRPHDFFAYKKDESCTLFTDGVVEKISHVNHS